MQLLLGTDFLCPYPDLTCLWRKPEIQMGRHIVPLLNRMYLGDIQQGIVRSSDVHRIPPFSSMMILVISSITIKMHHNQDAVQFEATQLNTPIYIANSISKPYQGSININLLNPTADVIT